MPTFNGIEENPASAIAKDLGSRQITKDIKRRANEYIVDRDKSRERRLQDEAAKDEGNMREEDAGGTDGMRLHEEDEDFNGPGPSFDTSVAGSRNQIVGSKKRHVASGGEQARCVQTDSPLSERKPRLV